MTPFRARFNTYKEINGESVFMENNNACNIFRIRSVTMKLKHETVKLLRNVRPVSHVKRNLISLGMLDSVGCEYKGKGGVLPIFMGPKEVLVGKKVNDMFIIKGVEMIEETNTVLSLNLTEADIWHKKRSHISQKRLEALSKQDILAQDICNKLSFCEHNVLGKARKQSFTKAQHITKGIRDYINSDLWGPTSILSLSGSRYLFNGFFFFANIDRHVNSSPTPWNFVSLIGTIIFIHFNY